MSGSSSQHKLGTTHRHLHRGTRAATMAVSCTAAVACDPRSRIAPRLGREHPWVGARVRKRFTGFGPTRWFDGQARPPTAHSRARPYLRSYLRPTGLSLARAPCPAPRTCPPCRHPTRTRACRMPRQPDAPAHPQVVDGDATQVYVLWDDDTCTRMKHATVPKYLVWAAPSPPRSPRDLGAEAAHRDAHVGATSPPVSSPATRGHLPPFVARPPKDHTHPPPSHSCANAPTLHPALPPVLPPAPAPSGGI